MNNYLRYFTVRDLSLREKCIFSILEFQRVKSQNWENAKILKWGINDVLAEDTRGIPKIVWIFWNEKKKPEIVDICIGKLMALNPNYEIRVLDMDNYTQYVNDLNPDYIKHGFPAFTDLLRLKLLYKYGGFWIDASVLTFNSLESIISVLKLDTSSCILFHHPAHTTNAQYPIFENWFIAAIPSHLFIKEWAEEFEKCLSSKNPKTYYMEKYKDIKEISQGLKYLDYLLAYLAGQVVLQKMKSKVSLSFINVEDIGYSYFYYKGRGMNNGDGRLMHKLWMVYKCPDKINPIIKLISYDRAKIDEFQKNRLINENSIIGKLLKK